MRYLLLFVCLLCSCRTSKTLSTQTFYNSGDNYWELCYGSIETNKTALLYDPSFKYNDINESESMKKIVSQFLDIDFSTNTYIKLNRKRKTITIRHNPKEINTIIKFISEPYEVSQLWVCTNTPTEDMQPYIITNKQKQNDVGFEGE
jgi:homoaconitase/3-isopropylmalate dehydratase large subunit